MPNPDALPIPSQKVAPSSVLSFPFPEEETKVARPRATVEAEILARCAAGDQDAMGELHQRLGGMLLALAMRITGDWRDAEDTVQEALLYAWKKAANYDPAKASVSTWLVMITRSRALDRIRKKKTLVRAEVPLVHEDISVSVDPEGFARTLQSDRSQRIRAALEQLPKEQSMVLELQFFRGLTQKEGALRLGIPLGTFKTRVLLAMKKLRRELAEDIVELR